MATFVDHAFAVFLVIGLPAWAARQMPKLVEKVARGEPAARAREYGWTIALQWSATLSFLWYWTTQARPFPTLGLALPDSILTIVITSVASIGTISFFTWQWTQVRASRAARAAVWRQFEHQPAVLALLPRTIAEVRLFTAASITAGICEEILYRGFLLWYFDAFLPRAIAIIVATVIFGVAHVYQGAGGIIRTGLAGAVAMVLYVLTGSLIAAMVLRATVDIASGWMSFRTLTMRDEDEVAGSVHVQITGTP